MSEPETLQTNKTSTPIIGDPSYDGKDWLASVSFGGGFQRSIYLLRQEFRWLVLVFFLAGFILSIILLPVNSWIANLDTLIAGEILSPTPDFLLLFDLLVTSMAWSLVESFVVFFVTFVLGTIAIYHVLKSVPSLHVLIPVERAVQYPFGMSIITALVTATILTLASVLVIPVPIFQVLFFFLPVLLVLGNSSLKQSFSLSANMRVKHWGRILSTLILGYILIIFSGVLGLTVFLNIESILGLYGVSLGIIEPFLLSLLVQIPVAMVAPLIPLFSIAFFAGARGAYREKQHEKYINSQGKLQAQLSRYTPLEEPTLERVILCQQCGKSLDQSNAFCTQCGRPVMPNETSH
jgi:hypothetical protein